MKQSAQPLVSISIVTCNSAEYIGDCLKSLFKVRYLAIEIIIFDNNSSDTTIDTIKSVSLSEKITLIENATNVGFAAAHNQVAKIAKGKYLFILNPDTVVTPAVFEPLIETMENDLSVAVTQPLVYLFDKKTINLTGKTTHFLGFDWIRDYKTKSIPNSGLIYSCSGSGMCVKSDVFLKLGGFDEQFFMYYEDSDFSWRCLLAGYTLRFVKESVLYHDYKYIPKENYLSLHRKLFLIERNRLATFFKNYSLKSIILFLPAAIFMEVGMTFFAFISGWGVVKLKSYFSLLALAPKVIAARKKVQALRKVSDASLLNNFTGKITFDAFENSVVKHIVNPVLESYFTGVKKLLKS